MKKVGFFDLKANIKGLIVLLGLVAFAGWYFGFGPNDVRDFFRVASTVHKEELPLEVASRDALFGDGKVLLVKNPTSQTIAFTLEVRSYGSESVKKKEGFSLPAQEQLSLGWAEGWEVEQADIVTVVSDKYMTGVYRL